MNSSTTLFGIERDEWIHSMELIRTDNVVKRYSRQFALGPINLSLNSGEVLGIAGKHGAGKTTLLQLIWGFLRPDQGSVSVFRLQPHLNQMSVRQRAGYLHAAPHFNDAVTARQHIRFVSSFYERWDESTADLLLQRFGIDPEMCVHQLSAGAKIKLALISAAGHNPSLLLLDDPLTGLNPSMRDEISRLLKTMSEERGIGIVVSSRCTVEISNLAHSIVVLNDGAIADSH